MQPTQGPGSAEYEARMAADIARLQGAKGINLRAGLRENRMLLAVFGVYLAVVAAIGIVGWLHGENPGGWLIFGVFMAPIVMLRVYLKARRRR